MARPELTREQWIWGLLRLSVGWLCLWAFLDKVFGLGYPTLERWAWVNGGSPMYAFIMFTARGILAPVARLFCLNAVADWAFMIALFFVGASLMLGIAVRLGGWLGTALFLGMYLVGFTPPPLNPFLSEHVIYAILCLGFALTPMTGRYLGLGARWEESRLVKRFPFLR